MLIPVISIVGVSDSGKTTLIEKLIAELSSRGLRVGTIKHDAHDFEIDHPGKDSYRHFHAGSQITAISSAAKVAVVEKAEAEASLDEIIFSHFSGVDIILTEGYKRESMTKIEVFRGGVSDELLSPLDELLLIATDTDQEFGDIQTVDLNDAKTIADAIADFAEAQNPNGADLFVDGNKIPLNRIMQSMVTETVAGLISPLKGVKDPESIQIRIRRDRK